MDEPPKTKIAFHCAYCKTPYGDPLYHGPAPHAPGNLCMDCWAEQWAQFEARMLREGDWGVMDQALWLICQGFTHSVAADMIGRHRNSIGNWICMLRKFPHLIPDWLCKRPREMSLPREGQHARTGPKAHARLG